ncbi:hypothetical protein [Nocardioides litoris]|nr:hypothetical protein [Nocardioides litoris]
MSGSEVAGEDAVTAGSHVSRLARVDGRLVHLTPVAWDGGATST